MITNVSTCRHCGRRITETDEGWIDPEATGDDAVWRETCDRHDTFVANHEPSRLPAREIPVKLTKGQRAALLDIHDAPADAPLRYSNENSEGKIHWKPADTLITLGLIEKRGGAIDPTLTITPAGAEFVASLRSEG